MGEIPQDLGWTVLVLIPKGITDTWIIGLIETLWKVVGALIDTHLRASLQLYFFLNCFTDGRVMGKAIMELKLAQELSSIDQAPPLTGIPGPKEGL